MPDNFNIITNNGHYDIYIDGAFYCSASSMSEAIKEIETLEVEA